MMEPICVVCKKEVRRRQHAMQCGCERWQHRTCNSGISVDVYRNAVRTGSDIEFVCSECRSIIPNPEDDVEPVLQELSMRIETSFAEPEIIHERSILDTLPTHEIVPDVPLAFELVKGGTQKGKDLLFDSSGHSYNVKEKQPSFVRWTCSVRNKTMKCTAGVTERGGHYSRNKVEHAHAPDLSRNLTSKVATTIHQKIELSSVWSIAEWNVFGQSVRTNNDVEGWHRRLNNITGVSPSFYVLLRILHQEARDVTEQVYLVGEMCLRRMQRKTHREAQAKLFAAWDSYREGSLSTTALLKTVSSIYTHKTPVDGGQEDTD